MQQAVGGEKKYKIFFGNSEEKKSLEALDVDNYTMWNNKVTYRWIYVDMNVTVHVKP